MKKSLILFWFYLTFSCLAFSQSISNVYVFSEKDSKSNVSCKISNESSTAAVKSALRYNRISVVNSSQADFSIYLTITNFEVDSTMCSVGARLEVFFYSRTPVPNTGKSLFLKTVLCNRGTTGNLDKKDMQQAINAELKSYVDECISSIEELLSK